MTVIDFNLNVTGHYFNHWPYLKIYHNGQEIFNDQVINIADLNFKLDCKETNTLQIIHYGKKFGDDDIWDSDNDGKQNCYLQINDIKFNDISGKNDILPQLELVTHWTPMQLKSDPEFLNQHSRFCSLGMMVFNGEIAIEFTTPIYNWLIDKKHKIPLKETAYFSDYASRWHYGKDLELIEEIKSLIHYDKNRSNQRSKD